MTTATFILIALIFLGLVLYSVNHAKVAEVGRIIFSWAFLVLCPEVARGIGAIEHLQRLGR